jgi:hypothetical protein
MAGQIILTASNAGTVTLTPANTGNAFVVTVPATTGNIAIDGPAFSAYQSSAQTLSSATNTKIQFQTEEFDTNNNFDPTTNYRFTPTIAGYYQVNGGFQVASSATGGAIAIYKNGSGYKSGAGNPNATTSNQWQVSALVYLNGSTDYVELYGYITTGQALVANAQFTYFQASMVRAA